MNKHTREHSRPAPVPAYALPASVGRRRWFARAFSKAVLAGLVAGGLFNAALARPVVPGAPGTPVEPGASPSAPPVAPGEPGQGARGAMRDLTPAQRQAIRQLSREQREAMSGGTRARPNAPGARLTPLERRQLRAQIREEHERNAKPRFGAGKHP